jgi:hypothetical protein
LSEYPTCVDLETIIVTPTRTEEGYPLKVYLSPEAIAFLDDYTVGRVLQVLGSRKQTCGCTRTNWPSGETNPLLLLKQGRSVAWKDRSCSYGQSLMRFCLWQRS